MWASARFGVHLKTSSSMLSACCGLLTASMHAAPERAPYPAQLCTSSHAERMAIVLRFRKHVQGTSQSTNTHPHTSLHCHNHIMSMSHGFATAQVDASSSYKHQHPGGSHASLCQHEAHMGLIQLRFQARLLFPGHYHCSAVTPSSGAHQGFHLCDTHTSCCVETASGVRWRLLCGVLRFKCCDTGASHMADPKLLNF